MISVRRMRYVKPTHGQRLRRKQRLWHAHGRPYSNTDWIAVKDTAQCINEHGVGTGIPGMMRLCCGCLCMLVSAGSCFTHVLHSRALAFQSLLPTTSTAETNNALPKSLFCVCSAVSKVIVVDKQTAFARAFFRLFFIVLIRYGTTIVTNSPGGRSYVGTHWNLRTSIVTLDIIAIQNWITPKSPKRLLTLRSTVSCPFVFPSLHYYYVCLFYSYSCFVYGECPVGRAASTCLRARTVLPSERWENSAVVFRNLTASCLSCAPQFVRLLVPLCAQTAQRSCSVSITPQGSRLCGVENPDGGVPSLYPVEGEK